MHGTASPVLLKSGIDGALVADQFGMFMEIYAAKLREYYARLETGLTEQIAERADV